MKIVIDIPKEFEEHFKSDRFEDSLQRCRCDIKRLLLNKNKFSLSRKYEIELLDMLTDAFEKGIPLPKGHGDLIDRDSLELDSDWSDYYDGFSAYSESQVRLAPTIIEAEGSDSE